MTISLHKLALTSAFALGLGAAPALADCHGDWDSNPDAMMDQNEFNTPYGENQWFGGADADSDGFLSQEEYGTGLYGAYDRDADGLFSTEEQEAGFGISDDYSAWDSDADGALTQDEFNTGIGGTTFTEWDGDSDGLISQDEFGTGVYGRYDTNTSGYIEDNEVGAWCDDYGEEGFWDL